MARYVSNTINQLMQEHEQMPTKHSRDALFSALFELNSWYIIELGDGEDRPPFVANQDDDPVLLVFTDEIRAVRALNTWLRDHIDTEAAVRRVRVDGMSIFLQGLARWGVHDIRFNHGPWSVLVGVSDVIAAAQTWGARAASSIDDLVDCALRGMGSIDEVDIWETVCGLKSWYFVSDVAESDDPLIWIMHDEPCVLVFTDEARARSYAVEHGLEGCTTDVGRLIEVDTEAAMSYLEALARRGVSGAMFNQGPYGFYAPLRKLCRLRRAA